MTRWLTPEEAKEEFGLDLVSAPEAGAYDAIILAVAHREFIALGAEAIRAWGREGAFLYDVKYALPRGAADGRL